MGFVDILSILLTTLATCVVAGVSLHKEIRKTKAAREANTTKKDDDRQSGPMVAIIIMVVYRGKE